MPRIGLLVTGPHGSGKSTAVKKALEALAVPAVYADDGGEWKKSPDVMTAMLRPVWESDAPVVVVEGTHRIVLALLRQPGLSCRSLTIHRLSVTPTVMRAHLRARCEKSKGRTFKADYWTTARCENDNRYYQRLAAKFAASTHTWVIDENYATTEAMVQAIRAEVQACLDA